MEAEIRFEAEPKPEMTDIKEVMSDTEEFAEPEKAKAIIKHLALQVGDALRENGEYYTINPRMVLEGNSPEYYKKTIENLKKILTKQEIKAISKEISKNTKKDNDKLYYKITKRTDKFYFRGDIKKSVSPEVREVLEFFKNNNLTGIDNTIYHLLSKEKKDFVLCYRCAWKDKPIPNIQKWREVDDGEYRVLTGGEADRAAEDYFDDDELWKQAVAVGNTTESLEDWKQSVISYDGRGSLLSGYDGSEEEEEINGTTYYIYRTN